MLKSSDFHPSRRSIISMSRTIGVGVAMALGAIPISRHSQLAASLSAMAKSDSPMASLGEQLEIAWKIDPVLPLYLDLGDSVIVKDHYIRQITIDSSDDAHDFSGIEAIDIASGETHWTAPVDWTRNGFVASNSAVFTVKNGGAILALSAETGDALWSIQLDYPVAAIGFGHDTLYAWGQPNVLSALSPTDGTTLWQASPTTATPVDTYQNGVIRHDPIRFGDSVIVTIAGDVSINAFNLDGTTAWTIPPDLGTATANQPPGTLTWTSGNILVAMMLVAEGNEMRYGPERIVTAYDMTNGATQWSLTMTSFEGMAGSTGGEHLIYVAADNIEAGGSAGPQNAPVVNSSSEFFWPEWTPTAYERQNYPSGAKAVFAIDAPTGGLVWRQSTGAADFVGVRPAYKGAWAGTADGQLVHLSAEDGALLGEPFGDLGSFFQEMITSENGEMMVAMLVGGSTVGIRIT